MFAFFSTLMDSSWEAAFTLADSAQFGVKEDKSVRASAFCRGGGGDLPPSPRSVRVAGWPPGAPVKTKEEL